MMTAIIILALICGAGLIWLAARKAGADHTTLKAEKANLDAVKARLEVDHVVQDAAAGGSADLAALARSSGMQRPE